MATRIPYAAPIDSRFMTTALSGTSTLRKTAISNRKLKQEHDADQPWHAPGEVGGEVGRAGGEAADHGVHAGRRDDVVAQVVDERRRRLVLRRALRVDDHEREFVVDRVRHAEGHVVDAVERVDEGTERFGIRCRVALDGDEQRAVRARPETFGEQVVRTADGSVLRVVARVAEAESDREQRDGEQEQEADGERGAPARPVLDETAPAVPDLLLLGLLRPMGHELAQRLDGEADREEHDGQQEAAEEDAALPGDDPDERTDHGEPDGDECRPRGVVDAVADPPEQCRQQGERRGDHHGHGERRGDGHALHERQPDEQQAEQGDDHGDAGEHHGASAGVDRRDHRVLDAWRRA